MIKNITKTITSMLAMLATLLSLSLLLLSPSIYAAIPPFINNQLTQNNDDTSKYLRILLNHTFGLNPDNNNVPSIQDPNRDEQGSENLLNGLIFLNPSDSNVFASGQMNGINAASNAPWWYDGRLDVPTQDSASVGNNPSYPANPTIQAIINSLALTYDEDDCFSNAMTASDCTNQSNYEQNVVNLIMDASGHVDQQKLNKLSISSLLDPLQYDETTASQQDAENFIRLISTPMLKVTLDPQYEDVLNDTQYGATREIQENAKKALENYNSQIIGYTSRSSVVMDNLFYLLSKRIANPDTQKSMNQAEFDIVKDRIDPNSQWKSNLKNQSLSATMQDIAELVAEQQYQSYLRGQENERLIATLTTLLIQQQEFLKLNYYIDTE